MSEKVAVYARVSTDRQEKEETIETQLMVVRDYCKANGYDATEYLDDGYSGITLDLEERPAGARLLEVAQNGRTFDKVIVYARDRLGRGLPAKLAQRKFDKLGITVISVTEPHTQEFIGRATSDFTSEIYAETVRKNTINGRLRSARAGRWPASAVPYGYKRVNGFLEEDPVTAAVVRRMYDLGDNGSGIAAIATALNEDGIPTASTQGVHGWQGTVIWKMITSERYIGKAEYAGVEIDIPALVTEEQFVRVGKAMQKRAYDAPRRTTRTYLLQKLLRCRTCGGRLHCRVWSRGVRRYMCYNRTRFTKTGTHDGVVWHVLADDAEARVIKLVEDFMADPENAANDMEIYADALDNLTQKATAELPELERRLTDLITQEDVIVDLAASRQITEAQLARKMAKVEADRAKIKAAIDGLKSATDFDTSQVKSSWARNIAKRLRRGQVKVAPEGKIIANADTRLVKQIIRSLIDLIWLEPDGTLTVEGPVTASALPPS